MKKIHDEKKLGRPSIIYINIILLLDILFIYPMIIFSVVMMNNFDTAGISSDFAKTHDPSIVSSIGQVDVVDTLHNYKYLLPWILFFVVEILLIILCTRALNYWKNENYFLKLFLIFSILLGSGMVFYPFSFIKNYNIKKIWHIKKSVVKIIYIFLKITMVSGIFASIGLLCWNYQLAEEKISMYSTHKINFSVDEGSENLIEICIDGFDNDFTMPFFNNESFKDFYYFPKFVTPGFFTTESESSIYSGKIGNNYWSFADGDTKEMSYILDTLQYMNTSYSYSKIQHILNLPFFDNYSFVLGTPNSVLLNEELKRKNLSPNITTVNMNDAKSFVTGPIGFTNNSLEKNALTYLNDNIGISKKAGSLFYSPLALHNPNPINKDGNYSILSGNNTNNSAYMRNYNMVASWVGNSIGSFLNVLKQTGTGINNVYDNSMIVIFGDHSSHSNIVTTQTSPIGAKMKKNRSPLLIKYPHTNLDGNSPFIVDDVAIYGTFLTKIEANYFTNKNQDQIDWMRNNINFDVDRNFLSFTPWTIYGDGIVSKFVGDDLVVDDGLDGEWIFKKTDNTEYFERKIKEIEWKD